MKFLMTLFFTSSLMVSNQNLSSISKALSAGDTSMLSSFFDEEITISILDKEGIFDKTEAIEMLKQFFGTNQPQSFVQMHQGQSKGQDSQYCIGNLKAGANTFRVYIYMKVNNNQYLIQELRFDRE